MAQRYEPDDPRYHERFTAALELLKLWGNIAVPDLSPEGGRYRIESGEALDKLVEWTDEFLLHPANALKSENVPKT